MYRYVLVGRCERLSVEWLTSKTCLQLIIGFTQDRRHTYASLDFRRLTLVCVCEFAMLLLVSEESVCCSSLFVFPHACYTADYVKNLPCHNSNNGQSIRLVG